jgi:hypothetical protein
MAGFNVSGVELSGSKARKLVTWNEIQTRKYTLAKRYAYFCFKFWKVKCNEALNPKALKKSRRRSHALEDNPDMLTKG